LEKFKDIDLQGDIIALSFSVRMLLSDLDREIIIERALDNLTDFGKAKRIGIFLCDPGKDDLQGRGGGIHKLAQRKSIELPVAGTPFKEVIKAKKPRIYHLSLMEDLPVPAFQADVPDRNCLCVPLISSNNQAIGAVTFDHPGELVLSQNRMQYLIVLVSVVALALDQARLFQEAVYDGLTGLYIRRYFDLRLSEEVNRVVRYGGQLAVMIMDIDNFKKLNDTYGHPQGDRVLQEVARILSESVRRKIDIVCRYGGDEFVIIMPEIDRIGAMAVADRIRESCEIHPFSIPAHAPLSVTLSGGLAFENGDNEPISAEAFLERADSALLRAKRDGRNRIQADSS